MNRLVGLLTKVDWLWPERLCARRFWLGGDLFRGSLHRKRRLAVLRQANDCLGSRLGPAHLAGRFQLSPFRNWTIPLYMISLGP